MIVSSSYTIGVPQDDGRFYVKEIHTDSEGMTYDYEYLNDGLDPDLVMSERAKVINSILEKREAARLAVVGTSVPLTRFQFLDRFTSEERVAIRELAKTDPVVEDFMEMMKLSGNVSLTLARPGLNYIASKGALTSARAIKIGEE